MKFNMLLSRNGSNHRVEVGQIKMMKPCEECAAWTLKSREAQSIEVVSLQMVIAKFEDIVNTHVNNFTFGITDEEVVEYPVQLEELRMHLRTVQETSIKYEKARRSQRNCEKGNAVCPCLK
jgi:hypothetical protein